MSKPKLSEIKQRDQSAPGGARFDVPYLLDLVKRLGKRVSQAQDVTGHTYDCPESLVQARILHRMSTATEPCTGICKKARALLLEIKE